MLDNCLDCPMCGDNLDFLFHEYGDDVYYCRTCAERSYFTNEDNDPQEDLKD